MYEDLLDLQRKILTGNSYKLLNYLKAKRTYHLELEHVRGRDGVCSFQSTGTPVWGEVFAGSPATHSLARECECTHPCATPVLLSQPARTRVFCLQLACSPLPLPFL
jgi:hypothetical protein